VVDAQTHLFEESDCLLLPERSVLEDFIQQFSASQLFSHDLDVLGSSVEVNLLDYERGIQLFQDVDFVLYFLQQFGGLTLVLT